MIQKIIKVGDSIAVTIPKAAAREFHIKAGDEVYFLADSSTGSISYTPVKSKALSSSRQKVASVAMNFINRYRDDLESLKDK